MPKDICPICSIKPKPSTPVISCFLCAGVFHPKCLGISLVTFEKSGCRIACPSCIGPKSSSPSSSQLSSSKKKMKKPDKTSDRTSSTSSLPEHRLEEEEEESKSDITAVDHHYEKKGDVTAVPADNDWSTVIRAAFAKERRKKELIVAGLFTGCSNDRCREVDDKMHTFSPADDCVHSFLQDCHNNMYEDLKKGEDGYRAGAIPALEGSWQYIEKGEGTKRMIKLTFDSEAAVNYLLLYARSLRKHPVYNQTFIRRSLSKQERTAAFELRQKRRQISS